MANAIFLVAGREMQDPRFREAVVLVTQPREGGPWGVIVNKPLAYRLADVFTGHEHLKQGKDVLFFGGPIMPDGLVFLARAAKPPPRSIPVLKDVYFTGDADWIDERLGQPDAMRNLRVYAGYSGWGMGQLQREMERGDWHVLPANPATIFDKDPALVWPELIKQATIKQTRDEGGGMRDTETTRVSITRACPKNNLKPPIPHPFPFSPRRRGARSSPFHSGEGRG